MIDIKQIERNLADVAERLAVRGVTVDLQRIVELIKRKKKLISMIQELKERRNAKVAELVDAQHSECCRRKPVRVRISPSA